MPLADARGPAWHREAMEVRSRREHRGFFARLFGRMFGWLRPGRAPSGDDDENNPGTAGAGRTAPLVPRTPVLSGSAARRLEDAET